MKMYRATLAELNKPFPDDVPITRECYIGPTREKALKECRAALEYKYGAYSSWGLDKLSEDAESFNQPFEAFVKDRFIIGDKAFGEGRNPALPRAPGRQSLHHARAMARTRAQQGDAHDRHAWRDFCLRRTRLAGLPRLRSENGQGVMIMTEQVRHWIGIMAVATVLTVAPSAVPVHAAELTPASLRLKWLPQAQFVGYYVATAKGWYKDEGIDLKINPGGPNIIAENMVASGADTFGHGGGAASLLQAREKGLLHRRHRHAVPGDPLSLRGAWKSPGSRSSPT